jgi:transposase
MLRLEGFMEIQKLHHDGVSVSEIARQLNLDRKTVRKYLRQAPREYERKPKKWKVDPFRAYLRERWESGVMNASRLFVDIQKRGYAGGVTQVRAVLAPWRSEGQERAFVRFETAPGEQAQMDWGISATGMDGVFMALPSRCAGRGCGMSSSPSGRMRRRCCTAWCMRSSSSAG